MMLPDDRPTATVNTQTERPGPTKRQLDQPRNVAWKHIYMVMYYISIKLNVNMLTLNENILKCDCIIFYISLFSMYTHARVLYIMNS